MLEVQGLSVVYPGSRSPALVDVSVTLQDQRMVVVGSNGSGKTTLLRACLGLAPVTRGRVRLFGREVQDARGLLPVSTNLSEVYRLLSVPVGDLIRLQARLKGGNTTQASRWIREFELDPVLRRPLHEISTGQAKLVSNLLALDHDPRLLLLDEPFENVDLSRRRRLVSLLRQARGCVLLNTHEFELLRHFEDWQLGFLLEGKFLGPYSVSDLDRLFLNRGEVPESIGQIRTTLGTFSITRDRGEAPLKGATTFQSLMERLS